jgi:GntR family transcriptional regulator
VTLLIVTSSGQMMQSDNRGSPKYLQIQSVILSWLASRDIGTQLPTEEALTSQFNVSRGTIRRALKSLELDGIIERRPRHGTRLKERPKPGYDDRITGPIEDFSALGLQTEARVTWEGPARAPREVATVLKLDPKETVYKIKRQRLFKKLPLVVFEAYFPAPIGQKIARLDLGDRLIVPTLSKYHDPNVWEEFRQFDTLAAPRKLAALLHVDVGHPLLLVKRLFSDNDGVPVVYFISYYRSDRYFYTINFSKPSAAAKEKSRIASVLKTRTGASRS